MHYLLCKLSRNTLGKQGIEILNHDKDELFSLF